MASRIEVLFLSGPNLNLLGYREPDIYGTTTLDEIITGLERAAAELGAGVAHHQSNHEGALVDLIHEARGTSDAIVINPGALTHYAWSLHDALATFEGPVIELHLTNPHRREAWRHTSVIAPVASAVIAGLGPDGYEAALAAAVRLARG